MSTDEQILLFHDFRTKFLWGIWLRFGVLAAGLLILVFGTLEKVDLSLLFWLLLFLAGYNAVAFLIHYVIKKQLKLWGIITAITILQFFDLLTVTFLIYLTGWLESPYWFLYLVLIVISGFGVFSRYSQVVFLIALFSAIFYLGLLLAAYFAIIPIYGPQFSLPPQELLRSIINRAVFTVISFFLFAGTIYYFSKALTQNQNSLTQRNLELLYALEEMKGTDRMKDEFVATASHELRTPLAVVRENTSLIKDGISGPVNERQVKLLNSAINNIDRLAKILDNLLNIAKIQSRSLELKRSKVDVGQLAEKAIDLLQELAGSKNITISKSLISDTLIWVDPDQILRVFINLIDNAIKYTKKGGAILVEVQTDRGQITCAVRDNGIGINPDNLTQVFERFVRFDGAEAMAKRGSGLGLSICKGIVEMHGGKLWVESQVGVGSKFIFTIPKVETNG